MSTPNKQLTEERQAQAQKTWIRGRGLNWRTTSGKFKGVLTPALFGSNPTKKMAGADLLGWCEYKPSNSGTNQTVGPKPSRRGGLGSLPNEHWCGSLEM